MNTTSTSVRAAAVAILCVAGCVAGPLALGLVAAALGAVTVGWGAVVGALGLAVLAAAVAVRRRRSAC
jgi:MYXO-CTERM domain-containing protein